MEYWRFDPSGGDYHDVALAGHRLVDGVYEPIAVEMLEVGSNRGYSDALGLYVCWEDGRLAMRKSEPVPWRRSRVLRSLRPSFAVCAENSAFPLSSIVSRARSFACKSPLEVDARKYR